MPRFPHILEGRVISQDVQNRRLIVELPSVQMVGVGVKMMVHGPADGVRVSHDAMPGRGTWGLCAFPAGDPVNGIWLGSFYNSFLTALTSNTDPFAKYDAHFSGAYEWMDVSGRWTKSFPDGTWLQISDQTSKPQFYRQTVDPDQNQQQTPFSDGDRVANPPSQPYTLTINHGSGAVVTIDPKGFVTVKAAQGQNMALSAQQISMTAQLTTMSGDLHVSGTVIGGFGTADQIGLQTHRHGTTGTLAAQTIPPSPGT